MKKNLSYLGLIVLGSVARILPHPPNFTPTGALAFFSGNKIANRLIALAIPLGILITSDLIKGWHATMPFVYGSFAVTVMLGKLFSQSTRSRFAGLLLSSVIFFVVTNFGTWLVDGMYPHTLAGLGICYAAAIPFFRNELAATLFYGSAFFALAALLEKSFRLEEAPTTAAIRS